MGATNRTPRGLSQFLDNDKPTWRGDYNSDMQKIDAKFDTIGFDPMDYGAIGNGIVDDTAAVQAAIDAAKAAGGGRVILNKRYGWKGDLIHRGSVTVEGVALRKIPTVTDHLDRGLVALDATARYRYGLWTADSTDDNPGPLKNLIIDGNSVGGGGTKQQLVLMESVNGIIDGCQIVAGAKDGLEIGGSQNGTIDQCYIGDCPNGAAISVWNRAGQGAGQMKITNTYISTSKIMLVSDQDPTNFWPHDIFFDKCLFENYVAGNNMVELKAGDFQFSRCFFTYSLTGAAPSNDCLIFVHQPTVLVVGTRAIFDSCYFNGGTNGMSHCVRVKTETGGFGNFVRFYGTQQIANCGYVACVDAGFSTVSYDGSLIKEGGTINWWTAINGGILAAVHNEYALPTRWNMPVAAAALLIGDPIQVRTDADTTDRFRIDAYGTLRWLDGSDPNVASASISRDTTSGIMHYGGTTEVSNALLLRQFAFLVNAANTAVAMSAAGTANPAYVIGFTAGNSSANVTITGAQLGSQLQVIVASGVFGDSCSITWPANVKFAGEDIQPASNISFVVTLAYDGTNWIEVSRSGQLNQTRANRIAAGAQEIMPREFATLELATVSGYTRLSYFTAYKDATVTALRSYTGASGAAAGATVMKMGLYSVAANGDLTLIASTAHDATLWIAAYTTYTKNLIASVNVKRGSRYAFAYLFVGAGAAPVWPYQTNHLLLSGTNPRLLGQIGGQTDLAANIAAASVNNGSQRYYGELVGI